MKNRLSVFIVPDSGRVRQFSISKSLTIFVTTFVAVYTVVSVVFSVGFFSRRVEAHKIDLLTQENLFLSGKLENINESVDSLRGEIVSLTEKEMAIRTIFELPEIDPQQRELGIGGPDMLPAEEIYPSRVAAYQSEAEIDRLISLSSFEKEQFNTIYQHLLDKKYDLDRTPSIWPTKGYLIRGFGMKADPFTGEIKLHSGLDISNKIGTPIFATADGTVITASLTSGLGNTVVIDHENGIQTVYGHLSQYRVKVGQQVKRGTLIALMGNTGYSTGPHLHYEVVRSGATVNPSKYIYTSSKF